MNVNKVLIVGRMTRDPVLRVMPSGTAVATLGIATNRTWTDQAGEQQDETEYHTAVAYGRSAHTANEYLRKGQLVSVEGRLRTRTFTRADQKHHRTEIIVDRVQFGPKKTGGTADYDDALQVEQVIEVGAPLVTDAGEDDVPF